MLNVQVHDSNVIKRLNKYGLFVRLSKWKPLSEKNMVAQFSFEKLHLHKRQASWTDDQRQGLAIMHSTAFDKKQTQDINTQHKHLISIVEHTDGDLLIWVWFKGHRTWSVHSLSWSWTPVYIKIFNSQLFSQVFVPWKTKYTSCFSDL